MKKIKNYISNKKNNIKYNKKIYVKSNSKY